MRFSCSPGPSRWEPLARVLCFGFCDVSGTGGENVSVVCRVVERDTWGQLKPEKTIVGLHDVQRLSQDFDSE